MFGNDDAATDAKLNSLVDGQVQVDGFALAYGNGKTSGRHRAGRHQNAQDRLIGGVSNIQKAFSSHETHRPDSSSRVFDRNDASKLKFIFAKCKICHLFDGRVDVSNDWQLVDQRLEVSPPVTDRRLAASNLPSRYSSARNNASTAGKTR